DHVYKMDYSQMLESHKEKGADATIAVMEVPIEQANQFGIMNTDEVDRIIEFEEKPKEPKSNLASMGIYIFTWSKLREALITDNARHEESDFGKHIIPTMIDGGQPVYAYRFNDYWRDIGTIESYWLANMELTYTLPEFNLYDEFWKIYTSLDNQPPEFISHTSKIGQAIISEGCEVYGEIQNAVLGPRVVVEEGAIVRNAIVMQDTVIKKGAVLEGCIISEKCIIGGNTHIGQGENKIHEEKSHIYSSGITVIGAGTIIPDNVVIGKNCEISGQTIEADYVGSRLESGHSLIV
ncbi:MAG: sugar phosphate nucleotidyltransferase, partial [Cellulosilyticaceae bacterium]